MFKDYFFDKQPPMLFIDDLKKEYHSEKPVPFGPRAKADNEIEVIGLYLSKEFEDKEGLLETVYEDFEKFIAICEIKGDKIPVRTVYKETSTFEEYEIEVNENEIIVYAADTEGIRRGLIYIEDELVRNEGPYLVCGKITKTPKIKERITRCFFSPINRPPKNGDELSDDIDYYPDNYLARLMHDGSNGVWIYSRYADLIDSPYIEEYGKGKEARIDKLNKVIKKCARYGVGVYIFAIEPDHFSGDMIEKYSHMTGATVYGGKAFCTSTEEGKDFCYQAGKQLFESAPGLKGFICITNGERSTACSTNSAKEIDCPRCTKYTPGERLAKSTEVLMSGMREQKPDAKLISWTYGHRSWKHDDIAEYVEKLPKGIVPMQNFDDAGYPEQLGRTRCAFDYWMAYVGPSEMFEVTANAAKEAGNEVYAKMQVCNSHELASVPYIPVPGIVYDKFKSAIELGVTGVMECWFFGNYPSLMSKTAGEVSFEDFKDSKEDFIKKIAGISWGRENAEKVAKAYEHFEKGYKNYPVNIMFSYYGPMHDSVVWELQLLPKNNPLPRTWLSIDAPIGDRIGECILSGHTLDEVVTLLTNMEEEWAKGMKILDEIGAKTTVQKEEMSVIKAMDLLVKGAKGVINFYKYRDLLGRNIDAKENLDKMREIVYESIKQSEAMIPLCKADNRLGYHSEAEGFKFFPEKLERRINQLKTLLETEFVEVEQRIAEGKYPLEYYLGKDDDTVHYQLSHTGLEDAKWDNLEGKGNFRMALEDNFLTIEVKSDEDVVFNICPEFTHSQYEENISFSVDKDMAVLNWMYNSIFGELRKERLARWSKEVINDGVKTHMIIKLDLDKTSWDKKLPFKIRIESVNRETREILEWCVSKRPHYRLGHHGWGGEEFGWVMP